MTHTHTQQNRPDVRVHAFFPPHTPPPPTAPQRRRVVCHCCTLVWCNHCIVHSLILFTTIYSNITSSYHPRIMLHAGQSPLLAFVWTLIQFQFSSPSELIPSLVNYSLVLIPSVLSIILGYYGNDFFFYHFNKIATSCQSSVDSSVRGVLRG